MTNHWIDIKNSDCVLIMGANPAENHPISFRWILEAQRRGATIISVDPRFTRSSAQADVYAPLRSGSDVAFLGGLVRYVIEQGHVQRDYVAAYTNAACLLPEGFGFDVAAGTFSGYAAATRSYDRRTWQYDLDETGAPRRDPALADPRCVFQILRRHFARYDLETVSGLTGTPRADLERVYAAFASTGAADRAGTILYAMGWTQHTTGTQTIRTMAIAQLLLGNIGRAGGGVNALRGESNVQGSTDHALLYHILPGYLKTPRASQATLAAYLAACTPTALGPQSANWWGNYPKYAVSLLKALYAASATPENAFAYDWLPKLDDGVDYSWLTLFDEMYEGRIRGLFAWGQNPACSGANAVKVRGALARLDWLVTVNLFPNETGWFFEDPRLGVPAENVATEVFVLPAAASVEKGGSITNSGRWMQWRTKAAEPPGEALPDSEILYKILSALRRLYREEGGAFPDPVRGLRFDAYFDGAGRFDAGALAREINGRFLEDVTDERTGKRFAKGAQVPSFAYLRDDGKTSSGNWLYCGSWPEAGNMAARRTRESAGIGLHASWAWCWPLNRRILYNRASVDPQGRPFDPARAVIRWEDGHWVGDVPDGGWPPLAVDPEHARLPFIMKPEGLARIFAMELKDGPLPEHYEPLESPLEVQSLSGARFNPGAPEYEGAADRHAAPADKAYPYVCTTYRVTEHWQTGVMTRTNPLLMELQPQLFVEMDRELAREKRIEAGEPVRVVSARGEVTAIALPTARLRPLQVAGRTVHQVGLPYCFGWLTPQQGRGGDSANVLTPTAGDANTRIPETKAFLVDLHKIPGARPGEPLPEPGGSYR